MTTINHDLSNESFFIQLIEKSTQNNIDFRLRYLSFKIEFQIISNYKQYMIDELMLNCLDMFHYILYVRAKNSFITNIDHNIFFCMHNL